MTDRPVEICETVELPDGRLLVCNEYGDPDGSTVLVVHGTPGSRFMAEPADEFARVRGLRLIAPDRPGYGHSSARKNASLLQWVEDIEFLLMNLKIDRFAVLGISGGGPFATALATCLPDRVRLLALVSPVGIFNAKVRQSWTVSHRLFFKILPGFPLLMPLFFWPLRFLVAHIPRLPLGIFIKTLGHADQLVLRKPENAEQLLKAVREGMRLGIRGVQSDLRIFASPWTLPFEQAHMPVILWQGLDDEMVPPPAAFELAKRLPAVQVISLEGAGHFWIFDHVEEVLETLAKDLGNVP